MGLIDSYREIMPWQTAEQNEVSIPFNGAYLIPTNLSDLTMKTEKGMFQSPFNGA